MATKKVFLGGLSPDTTEREIEEVLETIGKVRSTDFLFLCLNTKYPMHTVEVKKTFPKSFTVQPFIRFRRNDVSPFIR